MRNKRLMTNNQMIIPQVYYYPQPATQSFVPFVDQQGNVIDPNKDQRFGGFLLPAVGGFLVGTLVPRPWGNQGWGYNHPPMYYNPGYTQYGQTMLYAPYPNVTPTTTNN